MVFSRIPNTLSTCNLIIVIQLHEEGGRQASCNIECWLLFQVFPPSLAIAKAPLISSWAHDFSACRLDLPTSLEGRHDQVTKFWLMGYKRKGCVISGKCPQSVTFPSSSFLLGGIWTRCLLQYKPPSWTVIGKKQQPVFLVAKPPYQPWTECVSVRKKYFFYLSHFFMFRQI